MRRRPSLNRVRCSIVSIFCLCAGRTIADTYPIAPRNGDLFYVGDTCRVSWTTVHGSSWNSTRVELMSRIETPILVVAKKLDTSSSVTLAFKCPDVTLYEQIYYYRFTNNDNTKEKSYSPGRFTIADKVVTKGLTIPVTKSVTRTAVWTYNGGDRSTVGWDNGELTGPATRTKTLPTKAITTSGDYVGGGHQTTSKKKAKQTSKSDDDDDSSFWDSSASNLSAGSMTVATALLATLVVAWLL